MNTSSNPLIRPETPFQRRVVDAIDRAKPARGVGLSSKPLPGGVSQIAKANARAGVTIHPFYILRDGKIHAGTVNSSTVPTLGGDPIGESGNALTMTGDKYVYVCDVWALTFGAIHFLSSVSLTTSTIVTSPTLLTDDTDIGSGTLTTYCLIAQIIDGVVQRAQTVTTNLFNGVCDASTGAEGGKAVNSTWSTA
jgi:hypothetical protein